MKPRYLRAAIALLLFEGDTGAEAQTTLFLQELQSPIGAERVVDLAADVTGVYVFGQTNSQQLITDKLYLRKYSHTGRELWVQRLGAAFDNAYAVGVMDEDVYTVGSSAGTVFLRKYDAGGIEQWARQLSPAAATARFRIATDETGIYVSGFLAPAGGPTGSSLRKFDSRGTELWSRQLELPGALAAMVTDVAAHRSGIWITIHDGWGVSVPRSALLKYDVFGAEQWRRSIAAAVTAVAVSEHGTYVLVNAGAERTVRAYTPEGDETWTAPAISSPDAGDLAADDNGVYVIGSIAGTLPRQCTAGERDIYVRRLDPSGGESWTRQLGTAGYDHGGTLAVHASDVYVGGNRSGAKLAGTFFAKLGTSAPSLQPGPFILWDCVLNSASYQGGGVAPGEIVTILGSNLGPGEAARLSFDATGRVATTLAGTRVFFDDIPAPMLYASENQTSAIVPYAIADQRSVRVQIEYGGVRSNAITLPVLEARPGLFTVDASGHGQALAMNQDGSMNTPANAAERGSIVVLYGTGEGPTDPAGVDGLILTDVCPKPKLPFQVILTDGIGTEGYDSFYEAEVLQVGGVMGSVSGLVQINVRLHADMPSGVWAVHLVPGPDKVEWGDILPRSATTISIR